jgi:hypothetical protein
MRKGSSAKDVGMQIALVQASGKFARLDMGHLSTRTGNHQNAVHGIHRRRAKSSGMDKVERKMNTPEGWPTEEMANSARNKFINWIEDSAADCATVLDVLETESTERSCWISFWEGWKAALAAAPTLPAQDTKHEREVDRLLKQIEYTEEWADKLANAIAERLGVDIGEHSNLNNPWQEALNRCDAPAQDCGTVCRASHADGIVCPHDSCDIEDGVRETPQAQESNPTIGEIATVAPTPPAQEDEPVLRVYHHKSGVGIAGSYKHLPDGTKFYTRPADDKLKGTPVGASDDCGTQVARYYTAADDKLRKAVEGNSLCPEGRAEYFTAPADSTDEPNYRHEYAKTLARIICMKKDHDKLRNQISQHLSIVHRDGGQYEETVGTEQAINDATKAIQELRKAAEDVVSMFDNLQIGHPRLEKLRAALEGG